MDAPEELRIRVERLLRGSTDPTDVSRLVTYIRDNASGRHNIADVGHFVHWDKRSKGVAYTRAINFYDMWAIHGNALYRPVFTPELHARAMHAALRVAGPSKIKQHTKLPWPIARKRLDTILAKMHLDARGQPVFAISHKEDRFLQTIIKYARRNETLTQSELFNEFESRLLELGALRKSERKEFAKVAGLLAAFTIAAMHRVPIIRGGDKIADLRARIDWKTDNIGVDIDVEYAPRYGMTRLLFQTDCKAENWCSPDLLEDPDGMIPEWNFPIHMRADGKLERLA